MFKNNNEDHRKAWLAKTLQALPAGTRLLDAGWNLRARGDTSGARTAELGGYSAVTADEASVNVDLEKVRAVVEGNADFWTHNFVFR